MKVLAISNNIQFNKSQQTKVMQFKHSQDAFGFLYSDNPGFVQQIRIEAVFGRIVKYPVIEKIYRQQDGNYRNQNVSIDKSYTLKTGYLDENAHKALSVALKHSTCLLDGVPFFSQGEYAYDGDDDDTLTNLIQATATLFEQGYNRTTVTC